MHQGFPHKRKLEVALSDSGACLSSAHPETKLKSSSKVGECQNLRCNSRCWWWRSALHQVSALAAEPPTLWDPNWMNRQKKLSKTADMKGSRMNGSTMTMRMTKHYTTTWYESLQPVMSVCCSSAGNMEEAADSSCNTRLLQIVHGQWTTFGCRNPWLRIMGGHWSNSTLCAGTEHTRQCPNHVYPQVLASYTLNVFHGKTWNTTSTTSAPSRFLLLQEMCGENLTKKHNYSVRIKQFSLRAQVPAEWLCLWEMVVLLNSDIPTSRFSSADVNPPFGGFVLLYLLSDRNNKSSSSKIWRTVSWVMFSTQILASIVCYGSCVLGPKTFLKFQDKCSKWQIQSFGRGFLFCAASWKWAIFGQECLLDFHPVYFTGDFK